MKKILMGLLVAALLITPAVAKAQSVELVNPSGNEVVLQQLINQVIALLMQQVSLLQEQIAELKAQDGRTTDGRGNEGRGEAGAPAPKPTTTVIRCELAHHREGNFWTRINTTWQEGEDRTAGRYDQVRECRRVVYYDDGSGIVSEEPVD